MVKFGNQNGDRSSLVFLRNNPHPMWIFDHTTLKFREVNHAAIAKYGYSRSEFLKMKITEIRPSEQIPKLLAGIRPFRLEAAKITDRQHVTKDGKLIDVEIIASQFHFKGRKAVLVEVQDITERKKSEEALRALATSEERKRISAEVQDTLVQGFTGVLLQLEASLKHLLDIVNAIHEGRIFAVSNKAAIRLSSTLNQPTLTTRETEVLKFVATGKSNKEIAQTLSITEGTVKIHMTHILKKLTAQSRTEAVSIGIKKGFVRLD